MHVNMKACISVIANIQHTMKIMTNVQATTLMDTLMQRKHAINITNMYAYHSEG
jgi:hypothetical protein